MLCLILLLLHGAAEARHFSADLPLPVANTPPCQEHNLRLSAFLRSAMDEVGK